jgi:hypothetical protein
MGRKQLLLIAVIAGGVAFLAVFLPWWSIDFGGAMPAGFPGGSHSVNGTADGFHGVWVIVFACLGIAAVGLVLAGKTDLLPIDAKQHLLAAVALFGLATLFAFLSMVKDTGNGGMLSDKVSAGKSIGVYLCFLASAAAAGSSFMAFQKSEDETAPAPD